MLKSSTKDTKTLLPKAHLAILQIRKKKTLDKYFNVNVTNMKS